jgi:hypothetical protein
VALCDGAGPAGLLKQARAGAAKRFAAAMDSYPLLFVTLDAAGGLGVALAIAATTATPRPRTAVGAEHRQEDAAPEGQTATA